MSQNEAPIPELSHIQLPALAAGVLGLAVCGLGWFLDPAQFFHSYLFAYLFAHLFAYLLVCLLICLSVYLFC